MPDSISPKGAALWFASHGYAVLPLHGITQAGCTCGDAGCAARANTLSRRSHRTD